MNHSTSNKEDVENNGISFSFFPPHFRQTNFNMRDWKLSLAQFLVEIDSSDPVRIKSNPLSTICNSTLAIEPLRLAKPSTETKHVIVIDDCGNGFS